MGKFLSFFILSAIVLSVLTCEHNDKQTVMAQPSATNQLVDLVYPQLDTENSRWFLFSSASRPFGMVNLSPDTKLNGTWGSGYRHEIDTVKGFSHIHGWQLSGLSVMPISSNEEESKLVYTDFYSKFRHDTEKITPGYHFLHLDRHDIDVELTGTERVGFHRYTFQNGSNQEILFLLNATLGPCSTADGQLRQETPTTLSGSFIMQPTERRPKAFKVHFKVALNTEVTMLDRDGSTGNYKLKLESVNTPVLMKVALSYTSLANAEKNMEAELPYWDFDQIVTESKNHWNEMLGRIKVEGGSEISQRRFYTDLWHALLGRKMINDVNGAYPDNTGEAFRIGQLPMTADGRPQFNHYNSDAFWGAQWTINTLWGLVYPEIKQEFVKSLLQYYTDGGLIPRGPSGGNYTYVMTGSSSTPFIVSTIQQGLIDEDLEAIYNALKKNHLSNGIMAKAGYEHETSLGGGLSYYEEMGYVPYPIPEGKFGLHQDGAGLTLEYAYQDYALAQLAKKLGHTEDYEAFLKRSQNYKHVFDTETGWMRPKNVHGEWKADFDPYVYENGFNESNSSQSTWFVPHDLEELAVLMGGKEAAIKKLDQQFREAESLGFTAGSSHDREKHPEYSRIPINFGNQPSLHSAYIFGELGRHDLTQYWSRRVVNEVFSGLSPKTGYNGDEDQGLMGSLAVLKKIGLFQMDGGVTANSVYQIGSPIFEKITIKLNNKFYPGDEIVINADGNSDTIFYIKDAKWNSKTLDKLSIDHQNLIKGGVLNLEMGADKNDP